MFELGAIAFFLGYILGGVFIVIFRILWKMKKMSWIPLAYSVGALITLNIGASFTIGTAPDLPIHSQIRLAGASLLLVIAIIQSFYDTKQKIKIE